ERMLILARRRRGPRSPLFPYTTLFRSPDQMSRIIYSVAVSFFCFIDLTKQGDQKTPGTFFEYLIGHLFAWRLDVNPKTRLPVLKDRKSTRLNSSHLGISYAVFCLKKQT